MNKNVKNFKRYTFHKDGSVTNTASGKTISLKSGTTDTYQLLNDAGSKVTVKISVVKAEAAKGETPKKAPAPKKPAAPKKASAKKSAAPKIGPNGKTHKPTLNYDKAQEIRKKVAAGADPKDMAKEYEVSMGTIYFTLNYTNYPVKQGDKIHIPYPDGWLPRKERNAAKAK